MYLVPCTLKVGVLPKFTAHTALFKVNNIPGRYAAETHLKYGIAKGFYKTKGIPVGEK
jgi:hypothetical protein